MMTSLPVLAFGASCVGAFEWWLAVKRTLAIMTCRPYVISITVFLETFLAFIVAYVSIRELPPVESFVVYGAYCIGGALGSVIPMRGKAA
jgi:hypothetical protein